MMEKKDARTFQIILMLIAILLAGNLLVMYEISDSLNSIAHWGVSVDGEIKVWGEVDTR